MRWPRLCVLCLLIGCGGDEDPNPKGSAGGADSAPAAAECTPSELCCKVCADSQVCGDTCISRDNECTAEPGCACDAADVCPEDTATAP